MARFFLFVAAGLLVAAGCQRQPVTPPPTTFPVTGKLLTKGGQPVTEGAIQFVQRGAVATKRANGKLGPDGTFELAVMDAEGNKYPGAEEGIYEVIYLPVMSEAQSEVPVTLPKKVTVKPNEPNLFDLFLP
jgi:hypothetical protein